MSELLILVDAHDRPVGTAEKMLAHRQGLLHRAFSIFILNDRGELLLQQRALHKYHSGGLWTNTCCSHPRPQEQTLSAAHRRLKEEMGFDCPLQPLFSFIYHAHLDHELIEYEYDHVLLGFHNGDPSPNPDEVCAWRWINLADLAHDLQTRPHQYTYWLNSCFAQFQQALTFVKAMNRSS